ncbi:MAG: hypothetical protein HGJ94_10390 [Desulfosarcina sp.]|nr:hypothetical protein [Desulfosarcina sp.]
MLRNSKILFALLVICLTVLPAAAQQNIPGGKWWQMPAMAKRLNLSARETRQLDDTYRESRRRMIRLKADLETEQLELQSLIEDPELDEDCWPRAVQHPDAVEGNAPKTDDARWRSGPRVRRIEDQCRGNLM